VEIQDQLEEIVSTAKKENRDLNDTEEKKFNNLMRELRLLKVQIETETIESEERKRKAFSEGTLTSRYGDGTFDDDDDAEPKKKEDRIFQIKVKPKEERNAPISSWVKRNFNVSEASQKVDPWSVIVALGSGRPKDKLTERALQEVRAVSGGENLFDSYLSAKVLETYLAKSHLANAGMQIIPMQAETHSFGRIAGYPSFTWATPGAATPEQTPTFDAVQLKSKTLRAWTSVTLEFLTHAINAEQVLRRAFTYAGATEIDRSGLRGTGTGNEPGGVSSMAGASVLDLGANGAALTQSHFIDLQKIIFDANGPAIDTAICSPREWAKIAKFADTSGQPLEMPPALRNLTVLESSKIPVNLTKGTSTNSSEIYCGNFGSLVMGVALELRVMFTPIAADTAKHSILCAFMGDFAAERQADLGIIRGVIP
jgi:HK97 family phage major capsid protein